MRRTVSITSAAILLVLGTLAAPAAAAPPRTITVSTTIQAAVDAARPGDTIVVPAGTYRETVLVDKSNISIVGSSTAVLDAAGSRVGLQVGTGTVSRGVPSPSCPPLSLSGFSLTGLTIKNSTFAGVRVVGVDGYRLTGTTYVDNTLYGPFPVCSRDGLIAANRVIGGGPAGASTDTGIYVGDDDGVRVERNSVTNYVIGIVVENSANAVVQDNVLSGNTAGIYAAVLAGHPNPFTDNVLIQRNVVVRNNLPNPVAADSGRAIGLVPTGAGIVNLGADRVVLRGNLVTGNDSFGVTIIDNFFVAGDPRVETHPDFGEVSGNTVLQNGRHPDPVRAVTPGADLVYIASGTGNCFASNVFGTDFPVGVTASLPCSG